MSGNVFELCFELYSGNSQNRQLRGGGWNWDPTVLSVSHRVQWAGADWRGNYFGFRYVRNAIGDMVTVQGGTLPQSSQLSGQKVQAFQIGRTEVTWGEWKTVRTWAAANGYTDLASVGAGTADNHPVHSMSWYDAAKWCNAKSQMEGLTPVYTTNGTTYKTGQVVPAFNPISNGYRLPVDAEWEWAACGGVSSLGYTYSGSNDANAVAWNVNNNSASGTKPVGTKAPNELDIYDMTGNVYEYVWNPEDPSDSYRRYRGGSWNTTATIANRGLTAPTYRDDYRGIRLVRNIGPKISISGTLPEATLNQAYAGYTFGVVGSTGDKILSISEGVLPPGMSFSANGTLSGTPTTAGTYTFVIRLESGGYWDEVEVELEVVSPTLSNLLVNGSFELPDVFTTAENSNAWITYGPNYAVAGPNGGFQGWSVATGEVDVMSAFRLSLPAADGKQFLDLDGRMVGAIQQGGMAYPDDPQEI
jgi:formylglycine-generating enzyme required for sulfatase activity